MRIGSREFIVGQRTFIMGILNTTPDSFSDGGQFNNLDQAIQRARQMIEEGADILDIGGESTRPNYTPIDIDEELSRVIPVIRAIRSFHDIPISIDTTKAVVAEEALKAGANLINDVWGFKADPKIAAVAAKYDCPCCLMHNRDNKDYTDLITDMLSDLKESVTIAQKAGIGPENIMIDPGIGFAKTYEHNLEALARME
ncbi:MAG: dihydropteroate synthase, partial [Clostridia bacterium]|nr:dihydropteroate synthase [Clostridia bacterium]